MNVFSTILMCHRVRRVSKNCATLDSGEIAARVRSASVLGKLGDARAVEPLIKALGSDYYELRMAAAEALNTLGEHNWVDIVRDNSNVCHRLGQSGDARAIAPLLMALESDLYEIRLAAVAALGQLGDARAVEPLIGVLQECKGTMIGWADQARAAATALGKLRDARAVEPLLAALEDRPYLSEVIVALGEIGDSRAIEPLFNAAKYSSCKDACAEAVWKIGGLQALIKATRPPYDCVSLEVAKMLSRSCDTRAKEPLIKWLGLPQKDIRKAAAEALRTLGEPRWAEIIRGDDDDMMRLCECGDARAVEALIEALHGGTFGYDDVKYAAKGLVKFSDARAVEPLITALENPFILSEAAAALGELRDVRAVEPLIMKLGVGNGDIRKDIAAALGKLGEPRWAEIIWGDDDDMMRLCKCGDTRAAEVLLNRKNNPFDIAIELVRMGYMRGATYFFDALRGSEAGSREELDRQHAYRRKAANDILNLAGNPETRRVLLSSPAWPGILEVIRTPRTVKYERVRVMGAYTEAYDEDRYSDSGIGIEIPPDL